MSVGAQALLAQLRAQRTCKVEVEPGKRIHYKRPPDADVLLHFAQRDQDGKVTGFSVGVEQVIRYVDGWSGITEADILGAGVGSSDEAEFSAELWAAVVLDRMDWVVKIGQDMVRAITAHQAAKADDAKN